MSETWVLDSFALLALLGGEPGSAEVAHMLQATQRQQARVLMTWVNVGEVAYIVERRGGEARLRQILALLEQTGLEITPVERELTLAAARLKAKYPLAYADAFAAALAMQVGAPVVTGDPEFKLLADILQIHWLKE